MTVRAPLTPARCVSILLVLLLLMSVLPLQASAASNNEEHFTLTGEFEGQFKLSSKESELFHLENIVPGDSWIGEIHIKNEAPKPMGVCLKSITSDIMDTVLFDALELQIYCNNKPLYTGRYDTGNGQATNFYELKTNETMILDVVVTLPLSAGNEVSDREMDSTWTFEAYYTGEGDAQKKPDNSKPQTGDNLASENSANIFMLWVILFSVIAVGMVAARIHSVKKQEVREVRNDENS